MNAVLFSAAWCSNCPAAKAALDQLGIAYTVCDVDLHTEAAQEAGIRGIPTIIFEDGTRYTTSTLKQMKERFQAIDT